MIWFILHLLVHLVITAFSTRLLRVLNILLGQISLLGLEGCRHQFHNWIITLLTTHQFIDDLTTRGQRYLLWSRLHHRIVFVETSCPGSPERSHSRGSSTTNDTLSLRCTLYLVDFGTGKFQRTRIISYLYLLYLEALLGCDAGKMYQPLNIQTVVSDIAMQLHLFAFCVDVCHLC